MEKLPNHHKYMRRLRQTATVLGLKVKHQEIDSSGVYIPSKNAIYLDFDLPDGEEIASFLHELGHALDDSLHRGPISYKISAAYDGYYRDLQISKRAKQLIIDCEIRAWDIAQALAHRLRIPLGNWFFDFRKECLRTYRRDLKINAKK